MGMARALIEHPSELPALIRMRFAAARAANALPADPHMRYCYTILLLVSRSFAIVIQQLDQQLRDAVCIFYVVLRALDTVEDDMSIPVETKTEVLEEFYKHLDDPNWSFICGEKHYRELMKNFQHLSLAFLQLSKDYQQVISDITRRMGHGMAEFIRKEVLAIADYDKYCYYVAGLVGIGLSHLFNSSGLENLDESTVEPHGDDFRCLSISMGQFLQKVNIIRDYLEDINEIPAPRMFWPREIWGKYAPNSCLADFKDEDNEKEAVQCLNHMITDCLRHAPECLQYMSRLKGHSVFRFCAIPQIMAIATASLCYNNSQVFKGVVKMRRGITARVMLSTQSMSDVCRAFHDFPAVILSKIDKNDPSAAITAKRVEDIQRACKEYGFTSSRKAMKKDGLMVALMMAVFILTVLFAFTRLLL